MCDSQEFLGLGAMLVTLFLSLFFSTGVIGFMALFSSRMSFDNILLVAELLFI